MLYLTSVSHNELTFSFVLKVGRDEDVSHIRRQLKRIEMEYLQKTGRTTLPPHLLALEIADYMHELSFSSSYSRIPAVNTLVASVQPWGSMDGDFVVKRAGGVFKSDLSGSLMRGTMAAVGRYGEKLEVRVSYHSNLLKLANNILTIIK